MSINCKQCSPMMIQGVFCHETGCPNMHKVWDEEEQEWIVPMSEDPEPSPFEECQYCFSEATDEWGGEPVCEECLEARQEDEEEPDFEYMSYSDADPGL